MDFINDIEKQFSLKAEKKTLAIQAGDVENTWLDFSDLTRGFGYKPDTNIKFGVKKIIGWYMGYYLNK